MYSNVIFAHELPVLDLLKEVTPGDVTDEITMTRIRLARAFEDEMRQTALLGGPDEDRALAPVQERQEGNVATVTQRVPDVAQWISWLIQELVLLLEVHCQAQARNPVLAEDQARLARAELARLMQGDPVAPAAEPMARCTSEHSEMLGNPVIVTGMSNRSPHGGMKERVA